MNINKDTLFYGSFSKQAGNVGCHLFNTSFKHYNINAIYKSFSITNIEEAVKSAKCLGFSGFAVSMPFKKEVIKYIDYIDDIVLKTNSCNTVIIKDNKLYGYNTDYHALKYYLINNVGEHVKFLYILGNGSYSNTLQICCDELNINYTVIKRDNWKDLNGIKNSIIFNCTPVSIENIDILNNNEIIQSINTSRTGHILAKKQASLQFELYTGKTFPGDLV